MTAPVARDFDPARISPGQTIAAVSGLGLFIFLFFHWFAGASAWQVFDVIDVLLAVIGLLALGVAVLEALGNPVFGRNAGLFLAFTGTVASSVTLTFVLEGNNRRLGLWLAFIAALGVTYGGWRTMNEAPGTPGPFATWANRRAAASAPTTAMPATDGADEAPEAVGGGALGGAAAGDPVPGQTGSQTPPGLAGEPPREGGTRPPGL